MSNQDRDRFSLEELEFNAIAASVKLPKGKTWDKSIEPKTKLSPTKKK